MALILSTQAELAWFEQVTLLVIVRRIMENKYARFLHEQPDAFADPWVAEEMSVLMRLNISVLKTHKKQQHEMRLQAGQEWARAELRNKRYA